MILSNEVVRIKSAVAEIGIKTMYGLSVAEFVKEIILKSFKDE